MPFGAPRHAESARSRGSTGAPAHRRERERTVKYGDSIQFEKSKRPAAKGQCTQNTVLRFDTYKIRMEGVPHLT
jgi:hypothetical protein